MASDSPAPSSPKFARLIPTNHAAKEAFNRLAPRFMGIEESGKRWDPHAIKYIVIDEEQEEMCLSQSGSKCDNGGDTRLADRKESIWTGYYQLDFDVPPRLPHRGWIIGSWNAEEGADIVLTETKEDGVSPQHAWLFHSYDSGALMIEVPVNIKIVVNGTDEIRGEQRLIHKRKTSIEIGHFQYMLEVADVREREHRGFLTEYQKKNCPTVEVYPRNLIATMSDLDQVSSCYVAKNLIALGGTCAVYAGQDRRTGRAVAIKKFRRDSRNAAHVDRDREVASKIGPDPHPQICRLVEVLGPTADDADRGYQARGLDEIQLIYSPLASWTLEELLKDQKDIKNKSSIGLFHEFLAGIKFLHSKGMMHRDIKPANLAVISLEPPRGQLIDFGHAATGIQQAKDVGTTGYHAPELCNIKSKHWYNDSIDIYSLGICMYRLFCRVRSWALPQGRITRLVHNNIVSALRNGTIPSDLVGLLVDLIQWKAKDRLTAAAAKARLDSFTS